MCGIAGIVSLNSKPVSFESIKRFTDAIKHRGPDGGHYSLLKNGTVALGHRRLSILDLSEAGTQPMTFENRYTITYNGEIYNFIELRKELESHGYVFKTDTDTEVILAAWQKWGKDCLFKFNGMWAFAIFDQQNGELFLSRDRFGVKPLYYLFLKDQFFAFASETIAFKHLDGFERSFDAEMLQHAIVSPNRFEASARTLFNHIFQLPAGFMMELKNGELNLKRWWNTFDHTRKISSSFESQVEEFKSLFMDACRIRLRSDVPLASALSGGVDSSAVYCMIHHLMQTKGSEARTAKTWQKAFVATFPGTPQDEKVFAEQVISFTKGDVQYIEPDYSNLASEIIESTRLFDNITGTPIAIVGNVYKAMRQNGIIVSMDGHGADELMYGYRASVSEAYYQRYCESQGASEDIYQTYVQLFPEDNQERAGEKLRSKAKVICEMEEKGRSFSGKFKKQIKNILRPDNRAFMPGQALNEWFGNKQLKPIEVTGNVVCEFPDLSRGEATLASDFHINHIPYNLRDFDRASMQHGIEIRMPFMDYRLVTFLFSLPQSSKLGHGLTKLILRESMKGLMPENIRTRKLKIGLSAPLPAWFNGELGTFITDTVTSSSFINSSHWNGPLLKDLVTKKTKEKSWSAPDSDNFWNILNAHLLLSNA